MAKRTKTTWHVWALSCWGVTNEAWLNTVAHTRAGAVRRANEGSPEVKSRTLKDWQERGHKAIRIALIVEDRPHGR
jgi:hypothetical protein